MRVRRATVTSFHFDEQARMNTVDLDAFIDEEGRVWLPAGVSARHQPNQPSQSQSHGGAPRYPSMRPDSGSDARVPGARSVDIALQMELPVEWVE